MILKIPVFFIACQKKNHKIEQKGRNRKCSIVQEEDDDIGDDEPSSPLNRRGSRSEGRINLTVQDRLAAEVAERIKKEQNSKIHAKSQEPDLKVTSANTRSLIDGIAGVKIIKNDDKEKFLGQAGSGLRKDVRSGSVDKNQVRPIRGPMDIKILTDSSTIPAINVQPMIINQISKPFKTMPSPTRSLALMQQQNANLNNNNNSCLKEILECDTGSSDTSNTNTPRPILRSQAVSAATTSTASSHHRRTKFHKSRTTSCSSSDASDDDNNGEKKRAGTKIIDCGITKQIITQRRDSDSSDSQDPGSNTCSGNGNAGSSLILRNGSTTTSSNNKSSTQSGTSHESRGKSTSNSSEIGYRRHRTGRRRQTETRLRESQSLNRITEVQECEHNNLNNNNNNSITNNNSTEKIDRSKIEDSQEPIKNSSNNDILMTSSNSMKISTLNNLNTKVTSPSSNDTIQNVTNELKANKNQNNTKAKGFSARFLQNLNFKRNHDATQTNSSKSSNKSNRNSMPDVPLTKLSSGKNGSHVRSSTQMPSDGSDRSKKIKILGRYFQVNINYDFRFEFLLILKFICHFCFKFQRTYQIRILLAFLNLKILNLESSKIWIFETAKI